MANTIRIVVEDIAEQLAAGVTRIELERAMSAGGSFSQVTTETLVADTYAYDIADATGTSAHWYRYRLANAGQTITTEYSDPFQVDTWNRRRIRQYAMQEIADGGIVIAAAASGCDGNTLATLDRRIKHSSFPTTRGQGTWLHPVAGGGTALLVGQTRMIASGSPSAGTFNVEPDWSGTPASGDLFEWHWLADPDDWNLAINEACKRYWYVEIVPVPGVDGQVDYSLESFPWLKDIKQITDLRYYPSGSEITYSWGTQGRWWQKRMDAGVPALSIQPAVDESTTFYLETVRPVEKLHTDDAELPPGLDGEFLALLAYEELLRRLLRPGHGTAGERGAWQGALQLLAPEVTEAIRHHMARPRHGPPQLGSPSNQPTIFSAR